jgi:AraC-like DNA-binding protein
VTPAWEYQLELDGDRGFLAFRETIAMEPLRMFAHEVVLAAFVTQTRTLYRKPLPMKCVELPFAEAPHASQYREYFYDVPIRFGRPIARVEFERRLLDERVPYADPATLKLAQQFCARLIPPCPTEEGLVGHMRKLLSSEEGPPPSLARLAKTLQTSTRTLRRELQKMHTSYKALVDESRRMRAEAWMKGTSMPVEQLATSLGFSTVGSFRRAYKRWTGKTPSAARTRHA